MISKFLCLKQEMLSYRQLEQIIRDRGLTEYVIDSIKAISSRVGEHTEERTFDGLALEAVFGKQLEEAGINALHNSSPRIFWYDLEFPDDGFYMDVKKHTSNLTQNSWLSIYNSTLNPGGQLFHLRNNGELEKLYIFFVNVRVVNESEDDVTVQISPSWIVRADAFFENMKVSKTPGMSYFNHRDCVAGVDYLKFQF